MPKVEQLALAGFGFVPLHHAALDIHAAGDGRFDMRFFHRDAGFQLAEQLLVLNTGSFDDLRHAVGKGFRRQRGQGVHIRDHPHRLPERPHQIFAFIQVDTGLSADRSVHLRQQGGGNLHKVHATQPGRRRETGHIAGHTAAQRHQQVLSGDRHLRQLGVDFLNHRQAFVLLARLEHEHIGGVSRRFKRAQHPPRKQRKHMRIGHDQRAGAVVDLPRQLSGMIQQAPPHQNVVRAGGLYANGLHKALPPS